MNVNPRSLLALAVVLTCLSMLGCGPAKLQLHEAATADSATVTVRGVGLETISVSVSTSKKMDVVIPAGTLFASVSAGTQNMMAAKSVTVSFPPEGQSMPEDGSNMTQIVELEVYCVNRFLDVPTGDSEFTVSQPDLSDPRAKFAQCMEGKDADQRQRQFAMWILSDNLWDYSPSALAEKEYEEDIEKKLKAATWDDMAELMRTMNPDFKDEDLDELKQLVQQTGQSLSQLVTQIVEADRKQFIDTALEDYQLALPISRRLLEECGHDVSSKPLFQN